jgi:arylsulfatase A-like enzyme
MNLIMVCIDSLRKDHVGAYGNEWIHTPHLDRFASESVKFTRAYPEIMPTIPFRRSLHTGKRVFPCKNWKPMLTSYPYTRLGTVGLSGVPGWNPLQEDETPIAEVLSDYGYETTLVTDVLHQFYPTMNFNRGFHSWKWIRGQEWDPFVTGLIQGTIDPTEYFTEKTDMKHQKVWELDRYMLNTNSRQSEEDYFPAQVFREATKWLEGNY